MTPKILRRCDICGRFHASYLVPADDGPPRYYCYDCWKARFETSASLPDEEKSTSPDPKKPS